MEIVGWNECSHLNKTARTEGALFQALHRLSFLVMSSKCATTIYWQLMIHWKYLILKVRSLILNITIWLLKPAQPVREQRLSCFLIFPTEPLWHYPPSHWLYWAAARVILMWLFFSCGSTSFSLHNAFEVCVNVSWLHRVMWPWNCWFISVYIPQRQGLSPLTILT